MNRMFLIYDKDELIMTKGLGELVFEVNNRKCDVLQAIVIKSLSKEPEFNKGSFINLKERCLKGERFYFVGWRDELEAHYHKIVEYNRKEDCYGMAAEKILDDTNSRNATLFVVLPILINGEKKCL